VAKLLPVQLLSPVAGSWLRLRSPSRHFNISRAKYRPALSEWRASNC